MVVDKRMEIQPGDVRCPRCFHKDIVPSLPRGWLDSVMRRFGRVPRHCRFCEKRFYVGVETASEQVTGELRRPN